MVPAPMKDHDPILDQYTASFARLNNLLDIETLSPVADELLTGERTKYGWKHWRPIEVHTEHSALDPIYAKVPARFPVLYERLVLSYRWAEVDLQTYTLHANPPGADLSGLLEEMSGDSYLWNSLLRAGYIPFGKGPDMNYDRVCFDISSRKKNRDFRIVIIDHEEILCNDRIKVVKKLASSFYELILQTIEQAKKA
jgi:hypothetical protein